MAGPVVRQERPGDAAAIARVVALAFAGDAAGTPPEVGLVARLRGGPGWLPELSLVAEVGGQVAGYVLLSRLLVGGEPALALGPVAVVPHEQGRGVGQRLVREALAEAERGGETLVVVLGDPAYYRRFGFEPARIRGVSGPYGDGPAYQALALAPAAPRGAARYPDAFSSAGLPGDGQQPPAGPDGG